MWKLIKRVLYLLVLFHLLFIFLGRFYNPPVTITQIQGFLKYKKLDRNYISYDDMGDAIKKAILASEDQKFFSHNGFDFKEIKKAIEQNRKRKITRGASTISQQTAKNIFLWQERSWFRKGLELIFTFMIEAVWTKKIILDRYLNCVEMGQGVFGVEAASRYYFGKSAKNLSDSEAAWIAAVLPNPQKYDPRRPSAYLKKKHRWIMKQMKNIVLK
ncbi:MAG: monofunctional biosynthetic peptidoglycan transglycosylase [Bergeyella sp.]|nr:monofunctional biosynthetic peptidoglycan transglycosylase [Bergeyella sp.]